MYHFAVIQIAEVRTPCERHECVGDNEQDTIVRTRTDMVDDVSFLMKFHD